MRESRRPCIALSLIAFVFVAGIVGCHSGAPGGDGPPAEAAAVLLQAGLRGDLNGSGTADVADGIGILRIVVGLDPENALADCTFDGLTGVADAIALLRCVVGLDPWPIGGGAEMVGPEGGTVATVDGKVTLDVPAGAVQSELEIAASPEVTYPADDDLVPGTCYEFSPDGTQFAQAAQLTICYDDIDIPEPVGESTLALHRAVGDTWEPVAGSVVDPKANTVSAPIDGFSVYAVLGEGREAGEEKVGPDGLTYVWVPGCRYWSMGSADGASDEQPVHLVSVNGFWLARYEVTNQAYATFLNQAAPDDVMEYIAMNDWQCGIERVGGSYQAKAGYEQHPVTTVSWTGADAYCRYHGPSQGLSLPTEAQWEYAAAGREKRRYPWGNTWEQSKCCNYHYRGPNGTTFPVGSIPAGASWCGAQDMAGNAREWLRDWYKSNYYAESPNLNPTGPDDGLYKVLRGGSWGQSEPNMFYNTTRSWGGVGDENGLTGFRCMITG